MSLPLPAIPDTGKIADGNDEMSKTRTALNQVGVDLDAAEARIATLETRVTPVNRGGTAGTTKATARTGLGITSGTANPSGGTDGDVYFKIV